jgi:hypothetical protein
MVYLLPVSNRKKVQKLLEYLSGKGVLKISIHKLKAL